MRISDWSSDVCSSDFIIATRHRRSFVELFGNDSGFLTGFALHGGRLKWRLQAGYNKGVPANPGVTVISARESIASIPSFAPPPGRRAPAPHPAPDRKSVV